MSPTPLDPQAEEKPIAPVPSGGRRLAPRGHETTDAVSMASTVTLTRPTALYSSLPPYPDSPTVLSPRLQPPLSSGPSLKQPISPTSSYGSSTSFTRTIAPYRKLDLPPPQRSDPARHPRSHHDTPQQLDSGARSHGVKRTYDMYEAIRPPPAPTIYPKPPSSHSGPPSHYPNPSTSTRNVPSTSGPTITPMIAPARTATLGSLPPLPPSTMLSSRFTLHLRQNPRAARAGPDGKDRRTIDPPPVLQLLIDDFDPSRERDIAFLKAHDWVVHAKLISAEAPHEDVSTVANHSERSKVTRLLLGTTVSSPFFCQDDPDSENAPKHPTTIAEAPPSPTAEILKIPNRNRSQSNRAPDAHKTFPGAFFIFPDLSIRKAGQYRLEFRLMKMTPDVLIPGRIVPTISVAVSDVFNVVNAKDFDQVQPSTDLVKGLLDRGAGFPLKLKKGLREGQRRKDRSGDGDSDDDGDGDDGRDETTLEADDNEDD